MRISRCLGAISSDALKQRVLEFSLSDKVRSQDTVFVIGGVTGTVEGRELCWQFVQDQWKELHNRYQGGFLLSRLVEVNISHTQTNTQTDRETHTAATRGGFLLSRLVEVNISHTDRHTDRQTHRQTQPLPGGLSIVSPNGGEHMTHRNTHIHKHTHSRYHALHEINRH